MVKHIGGTVRMNQRDHNAGLQERRRQQRWVQLGLMNKRGLVALYQRMMRDRGATTLMGGPVTAHDYRDAIRCLERHDEFQADHLAAAGPGHETCGHVNWTALCTPCGKTDGLQDDEVTPVATCTKPAGHLKTNATHVEYREGKFLASWRQVLPDD